MKPEITEEQKYVIVRKRVEKISKFYKHLAVYVLVNTFLSIIFIVGDINDGMTFSDSFFRFKTFAIWIYWGAGIIFQALNIFGVNLFFNRNWEQRKINQYLEEQNNNR